MSRINQGSALRNILMNNIVAAMIVATFVVALAAPTTALAQDFGDVVKSADHPGDLPFAITIDAVDPEEDDDDEVLVADLYSGLFYAFPIEDFDDEDIADTRVCPLGSATYSGLSYFPGSELDVGDPDDDREAGLYWIADDFGDTDDKGEPIGQMLVSSDSSGNLDDSWVIDLDLLTLSQDPFLSGLTYNPDTDTFWTCDIANDVYLELDLSGVATGSSFDSPAKLALGGGSYGTGLTTVLHNADNIHRLDITTGVPVDLRAARVTRVETDGTPYGLGYECDANNELGGWITGIAWAPKNSDGDEVEYVIDLTANKIVEVAVENPFSRTVTSVTCSADETNAVTLTWENNFLYSSIDIERSSDGTFALVENILGNETSYTDSNVDAGTYRYRIAPNSSNSPPAVFCNVTVGPGSFVNAGPHLGSDPHAITVIETTGEVVVVDLNGSAQVYDKNLESVGEIPNPFFDADTMMTATTTGIAWNSTTDTLFWYNDDDSEMQETQLDGEPIGSAIEVQAPFGGDLGDIAFRADADGDRFWGLDTTFDILFSFDINGDSDDVIETVNGADLPELGSAVSAVADPVQTLIDFAGGSSVAGRVVSVERAVITAGASDAAAATAWETGPSTLSGAIGGIAYTPEGTLDPPKQSMYVVAMDINAIYELNLESGIQPNFRRGFCSNDAVLDISDAMFLLFHMFVPGAAGPECRDACDINDDGALGVDDVISLLDYLFNDGDDPEAPFPDCAQDATPETTLGCTIEPCEP